MKKQKKQQPTKAAPAAPERHGPDPISPKWVRLNALRELVRVLGEERPTRFALPAESHQFYLNTPEETFCILVQHGHDCDSIAIGTNYSRATILGALVALACGADVSRVSERRVA